MERRVFYDPEEILRRVEKRVGEIRARGEGLDFITFVPDGEPTLDLNLGVEVELLKSLGVPIAVLTNGSLLWNPHVRRDLMDVDVVSVKVDAVDEELWRRINRPHGFLSLDRVLEGMLEFSREYGGRLITETMLIDGVDYGVELDRIAEFLSELDPHKAYVAIPIRPPAEEWVRPASERVVNEAFQKFSERLGEGRVEYLIGYEGTAFHYTGRFEEDILSITSVHPMREDAVKELLERSNAGWEEVERLIQTGLLVELEYGGHKFYMRRIPSRNP